MVLTVLGLVGFVGASLADVFFELLGSFLCNADAFRVIPVVGQRGRVQGGQLTFSQQSIRERQAVLQEHIVLLTILDTARTKS